MVLYSLSKDSVTGTNYYYMRQFITLLPFRAGFPLPSIISQYPPLSEMFGA
jgi:hypothetical protein